MFAREATNQSPGWHHGQTTCALKMLPKCRQPHARLGKLRNGSIPHLLCTCESCGAWGAEGREPSSIQGPGRPVSPSPGLSLQNPGLLSGEDLPSPDAWPQRSPAPFAGQSDPLRQPLPKTLPDPAASNGQRASPSELREGATETDRRQRRARTPSATPALATQGPVRHGCAAPADVCAPGRRNAGLGAHPRARARALKGARVRKPLLKVRFHPSLSQ